MQRIEGLLWDEHNERHISRHHVTPAEVEQVVFSPATLWRRDDSHRPGRLVALGRTATGSRWLVVVCENPTADGLSYVVTARPMNPRERRDLRGASNDD
ncbi:MAG TPA: BrnT family toxin [Acidimicrobiales bacterium]|nr:BrnT family toxin [Acidimicrobiales bacterium]